MAMVETSAVLKMLGYVTGAVSIQISMFEPVVRCQAYSENCVPVDLMEVFQGYFAAGNDAGLDIS